MRKPTITKTWIAGLFVLAGGLLVGGLGVALMLAFGGQYTPAPSGNGYDFTPTLNGFFWVTIGLIVVGFTGAAAGGIVQLAAWIGALVNTYQPADKTWFAILLVSGLLGFAFGLLGFAGMVAYLVAGPDGLAVDRADRPPQVPVYAPTSTPTPASDPTPRPPALAHAN
jgi:hypothetical protein